MGGASVSPFFICRLVVMHLPGKGSCSMKPVLSCLAILGLALLSATPASAAATGDYAAFTKACKANPDYLESANSYYDGPEKGIVEYCGCIVEQLGANLSQSDIDMLTADLDGTNTDEKRMAYETYEDLNAFYAPVVTDCLVIAGLADGFDPSAIED